MKVPRDDLPSHVKGFLTAIWELDGIENSHFNHLKSKTDEKSDWLVDEQTVYIKAGVALLTAAWEAYIEDIAYNAIHHLVKTCKNTDELPIELKRLVSKELKKSNHELSAWSLAGENWRDYCMKRLDDVLPAIQRLNTPNANNTKQLYHSVLGVEDITETWKWDVWNPDSARKLIDDLVSTRCEIAHGRATSHPINLIYLKYMICVVSECAILMNNYLFDHLSTLTFNPPWGYLRQTCNWDAFKKEACGEQTDPDKLHPTTTDAPR